MEKALEKKFEKVEEELNWSGLHLDDMAEVTEYTLERLREYLDEIGAPNEAAIIQEALDCVETHI